MENLIFAFKAIMPILLQITTGYFLAKVGLLKEKFLDNGNKFVFHIALPALLFMNVYNVESFTNINFSLIIYCLGITLLIFLLGLLIVQSTVPEDKQKGVILQCAFRSNYAIIGLSLAETMGGPEAKGVAAVLSAFSIPTFNLLSVIALSIWQPDEDGNNDRTKKIFKGIITNPLILSVLAGMAVLALRQVAPFTIQDKFPYLYKSIYLLSKVATPLALIVLGGRFDFSTTVENFHQITLGVVLRLVVAPLVGLSLAVILPRYFTFFSFTPNEFPAMVALFGSPVAVASAVMAEEMQNDGKLAAQLVVWTSIFSIVTLFIIIVILRALGLL